MIQHSRFRSSRRRRWQRKAFFRPLVEQLEDRRLLAATLLKDISNGIDNSSPGDSSHPSDFTRVGDAVYFLANDGSSGFELWKSDTTGTSQIEIRPGTLDAFLPFQGNNLTDVNGTLLFHADTGTGEYGDELYKYDTTNGVMLVKDINSGTQSTNFRNLSTASGKLYFVADVPGADLHQLWESDGLESGTKAAATGPFPPIVTPPSASSTSALAEFQNTLYFGVQASSQGPGLWKIGASGPEEVAGPLAEILQPPNELFVAGSNLYFFTGDSQLWVSDGTNASTLGSPFPIQLDHEMVDINDTLFFIAKDGDVVKLWSTDGTSAPTAINGNIPVGASDFTALGSELYFFSNGDMWKLDGDLTGTPQQVADFIHNTSANHQLTNINDVLYFAADDGTHGIEPWYYNPNEPATLAITADSANKNEGDTGTTAFTFTVTRGGNTTTAVSATWTVSAGSSIPADGNDFGGSFPTGMVNFAGNDNEETITVNVTGDGLVELDETFTVTLSNPQPTNGATITTATADGTIRNDDTLPTVAFTRKTLSAEQTNAGSVVFDVVFNRDVQNVDIDDFVVFKNGTVTTGSPQLAGSGTAWTITINSITGDGTLGLDLASDQNIKDLADNLLDTNPTSDQTYTIDNTVNAPTLSPPDDAAGVAVDTNLVLTFDETVQAGTGNVTISDGSSNTTIAIGDTGQITFSGGMVTINPTANLSPNVGYHVLIDAGAIKDLAGNSFGGFSQDTEWNFTTLRGFSFAETNGNTTVSETGTEDTFTVVLTEQPSSDVVISVTTGNNQEVGIVDGSNNAVDTLDLTFTNGNWDTTQTVTVRGINDNPSVVDGDQVTAITLSIVDDQSDDTFDPLPDQFVNVTTEDDDAAEITRGIWKMTVDPLSGALIGLTNTVTGIDHLDSEEYWYRYATSGSPSGNALPISSLGSRRITVLPDAIEVQFGDLNPDEARITVTYRLDPVATNTTSALILEDVVFQHNYSSLNLELYAVSDFDLDGSGDANDDSAQLLDSANAAIEQMDPSGSIIKVLVPSESVQPDTFVITTATADLDPADVPFTAPVATSKPTSPVTGDIAHGFQWTFSNFQEGSQSLKVEKLFTAPAPRITNITSTKGDGSYKAGEQIDIQVEFNYPVSVTGAPQLILETDGQIPAPPNPPGPTANDARVNYSGGSGMNTLTFTYTVAAGDNSLDLSAIQLDVNGGTIQYAGENVPLDLPTGANLHDNKDLVVDTTRPTVTINQRLVPPQADPTNVSPIHFTVMFSEVIAGFTADDLTLNCTGSGTLAAQIMDLSTPLQSVYDVAVSGMTGSGTVTASVKANAANDAAGNSSAASTSIDNSVVYDITPPKVTSIVRQNPTGDATNAGSVTFRVTFDSDVENVDKADFALSGTVAGDGTIGDVTRVDARTYDVPVTGLSTSNGMLNLDLKSGQNIQDLATNALTDLTPSGADETYTLDHTAPTVTVDPLTTNDTTPQLTGTVNDAAATISVMVGGQTKTATNNVDGTWTLANDELTALTAGTYNVSVTATDAANNVGTDITSDELVIDITAPTKPTGLDLADDDDDSGSSNTDNITKNTSGLTIGGSGETGAMVTLFSDANNDGAIDNGEFLGTATVVSGTFSIDVSLAEGDHNVKAIQTDAANNSSDASDVLMITVDTTAPNAPAVTGITDDTGSSDSDGITNDQTLSIIGTAEANSSVEVFVGGSSIGRAAANGSGEWSFDYTGTTLAEGNYTITATATDLAGNTSGASGVFDVTVDLTKQGVPTVSMPTDVVTVNADNFTITGTAEANSLVKVFADSDNKGTPDGAALATQQLTGNATSYSIQVTLTQNADNNFLVTATDAAGNASDAADVPTITEDSSAPTTPTITGITDDTGSSNSDGITNDQILVFHGTADANVTIELFEGTTSRGSTASDGNGNWSFDYTATTLGEGPHDFTAKSTDASNNTSAGSAVFQVTIDITAPAAPSTPDLTDASDTGTSQTDNLTNDTTPTFSGTAEAGATVKLFEGTTVLATGAADGSGNWTLTASTLAAVDHKVKAQATDVAGNTGTASGELTITIDTTAPQVQSVTPTTAGPTNADELTFTVIFDSDVFQVDVADFALTKTGTANGAIASVSGSGTTYTVTVNTITDDGTLRLDLNGGTNVIDAAGNAAPAFTSGSVVTIDNIKPVISANQSANLAENSAAGASVLTVAASDANPLSGWAITDGNNDVDGDTNPAFAINEATGEITVNDPDDLDRERQASFTLTVTVSDRANTSDLTNVTVNLTDVDEFDVGAVTDSDSAANTIAENATAGAIVHVTALASDLDATNNTITYSLAAGEQDNDLFLIDGSTGVVTLKADNSLDHETKATHIIEVTATSADNSTSKAQFTIVVIDVNEAPTTVTLNPASKSLAENTDTTSSAKLADIFVTDDALGTNTLTLSGADKDSFEIKNGTELHLKAGTQLNFVQKTSYIVTINVDDASVGNTPDATVDFTLTITDVNEPPTISDITNQLILQNSVAVATFTIADTETPAGNLILDATVVSDNPNLIDQVEFTGGGANRTVTVTPAENEFGTATITVIVSDGDLTASDSFVVTVSNPPTILAPPDSTINIGSTTGALSVTIEDDDTTAGNLQLQAASSNTSLVPQENILLGGSNRNRTVTVTPTVNMQGDATITLTVTDQNGQIANASFVVHVLPQLNIDLGGTTSISESGELAATLRVQIAFGSDRNITLTSSDLTEATVPATVTLPANATSVAFAITGVADHTLDGDQPTTIQASGDGFLSASQALQVTDAETLSIVIDPATFAENAGNDAATVTITRTNTDDDNFKVDLTSGDITAAVLSQASATFSKGQFEAIVNLHAVDDSVIDGPQTTTIQAQGSVGTNTLTASHDVTVTDHESLTLTTDASVVEGGILHGNLARPNQASDTILDVELHAVIDGMEDVQVISFEPGQISSAISIPTSDNFLLDGDREVTLTASAGAPYPDVQATFTILDREELSLTIADSYFENEGVKLVRVARSNLENLDEELQVSLTSSDLTAASVPVTVTIPANEAFVEFPLQIIDDAMLDGTQPVTVTASGAGYSDAVKLFDVLDFETIDVVLDVNSIREDAVSIQARLQRSNIGDDGDQSKLPPLDVQLGTSDTFVATPDGQARFMAGTIESEPFTIFIHDNDRLDPIGRFVQISAGPDQSSGYFGTSADLTVTDHEYLTISLASGGDTIPEDFEADVKIERSNVDEASGNNLTVSLTLDRTDAGTLSSDSIDLANDTSGFVQFAPANDNQWTGRRSVVITASVAGFFGDQFTLFIDEDEQLDFGDAPDLPPDVDGDGVPNETDPCPTDSDLNAECDVLFYPTLAINDGARHVIQSNGPRLGNKTDAEPDGQPSADATGDDTNSPTGSGDDEDGAWFVNPGDDVPVSEFVLGASYELVLDTQFDTAGSGEQPEAFVDYWIDWNGNGVWDESEHVREQVGTYDPAADNGSPARFFITVPSDAAAGDTYARFRVSTAGIETPTGLAPDGEVEDYAINVIVPEVSIDDAQVVEGDDGSKSLVFTVTRSTDRGEFSVNYQTANVTATAGADYTATSGTLPFADVGVLGQPISIPILGDQIDEDNETFTVTLTTTDGITLARDTATGTITDDDTAGITITPTSTPALVTTEAGGTATFTVQLDSQPTGEVTIALTSSDLSEATVSPSSLSFTSQNWDTPQTVTVTGQDDDEHDWIIGYQVNLTASSSDGKYNNVSQTVSLDNHDDEPLKVTTLDDELDTNGSGAVIFAENDLSLREAIALANAIPGRQAITFDPTLFEENGKTVSRPISVKDLGTLYITEAVAITGPGQEKLTISGGWSGPGETDGVQVLAVASTVTADPATGIGAELSGVTIADGYAFYGGGIYNEGTLTITASTISHNSADNIGGGIGNDGTLTITASTIANNSAAAGGGISNDGTLTITASTIANNSAYYGGGIAQFGTLAGSLTLVNTTVSGNSAKQDGGGIWSIADTLFGVTSTPVTLVNVTLVGNRADSDHTDGGIGGGIWADNTDLVLNNTIVAGNVVGNDLGQAPGDLFGDVVLAQSHNNLIGHQLESNFSESSRDDNGKPIADGNGNLVGGSTNGQLNPGLAPLADSGGLTMTHALLPDSLAIDAGGDDEIKIVRGPGLNGILGDGDDIFGPLPHDQRGAPFTRVFGTHVDIGAYEAQTLTLAVTTLDDELDLIYDPDDLSLREALDLANKNPGHDTITFDPRLFPETTPPTQQTITLDRSLGTLRITEAVAITGPGQGLLMIDGGQAFFAASSVVADPVSGLGAEISGVTITNGFASIGGGGISNLGLLTIRDCTISGNFAGEGDPFMSRGGGGIYNSGNLTITTSTIENNRASGLRGGGIYNSGNLVIHTSTISGNVADYGGGVYNTGTLTVTASTISGNLAYDGGGIYHVTDNEDTLTLINTTVSGNSARQDGGGIRSIADTLSGVTSTPVTLVNVTLVGNRADSDGQDGDIGGGLWLENTQLTLHNSIIAGNVVGAEGNESSSDIFLAKSGDPASDRNVIVASNNLIGDPESAGGIQNGQNGNIVGKRSSPLSTNRKLLPLEEILDSELRDNGGPTLTHALVAGSPAIDAGQTYYLPTEISGYVYVDATNSDVKYGLGAVSIRLVGTSVHSINGAPDVDETVLTDSTGKYVFKNVLANADEESYVITEVQPAGFLDGPDSFESTAGVANPRNDTFTFHLDRFGLAEGQTGANNNFSELGVSAEFATFQQYLQSEYDSSDENSGGLFFDYDRYGNLQWYINLGGWDDIIPGSQVDDDVQFDVTLDGNTLHVTNTSNSTVHQVVIDPATYRTFSQNGHTMVVIIGQTLVPTPEENGVLATEGDGMHPLQFDQRGSNFPRVYDGTGDGNAIVDIGAYEAQPVVVTIANSGDASEGESRIEVVDGRLLFTDADGIQHDLTAQAATGWLRLKIEGSATETDTLTVDVADLPKGTEIEFDAKRGGDDALHIVNTGTAPQTFDHNTPTGADGYNGTWTAGDVTVRFKNITPLTSLNSSPTEVTVNLPPVTDHAVLQRLTDGGGRFHVLSPSNTFEKTLVDIPSQMFMLNAGDGDDMVELLDDTGQPLDAPVMVHGDAGNDKFDATRFPHLVELFGDLGDDVFQFVTPVFEMLDGGEGMDVVELVGADATLDLTALAEGQLAGIERLDIRGSGANLLRLSADQVQSLVGDGGVLDVWSDEDDAVELGKGWRLTGVEVHDGRFYRIVEQTAGGTATVKLAGPHDWQNPLLALDVNLDGKVSPLDPLIVINELNLPQYSLADHRARDAKSVAEFPMFFYDVSGEGYFSALDALIPINYLNSLSASIAGEASDVSIPSMSLLSMAGNELATDKRIASEHATLRADFSLATDLLRQVSVSSDNPTRDFGRPLDSVYWCEVRCDEESRLSERDYLFGESDGEELWDPTRLEDILGTLVDEFYGR